MAYEDIQRTVISDDEIQAGGIVEGAYFEVREQAAAPTPSPRIMQLWAKDDHTMHLQTPAAADVNLSALASIVNPLLFKGAIATAAAFPTAALVQNGWTYRVTADVTDNDATKTNTLQSFLAGAEIAWNGTNWTELGATGTVQEVHAAGAFTLPAGSSTTFVDTATAAAPTSCVLPAAAAVRLGEIVAVGDYTGAAATHNITIGRTGADLIDGVAADLVLNRNSAFVALQCVGTGWKTVNLVALATTGAFGFMSAADKTKLDDMVSGAATAIDIMAAPTAATLALSGVVGKTFCPARLVCTLVDAGGALTGNTVLRLGTAAGTDDILVNTPVPLTVVGTTFSIGLLGSFPAILGNATVHLTVTTADGAATTGHINARIEGTEA